MPGEVKIRCQSNIDHFFFPLFPVSLLKDPIRHEIYLPDMPLPNRTDQFDAGSNGSASPSRTAGFIRNGQPTSVLGWHSTRYLPGTREGVDQNFRRQKDQGKDRVHRDPGASNKGSNAGLVRYRPDKKKETREDCRGVALTIHRFTWSSPVPSGRFCFFLLGHFSVFLRFNGNGPGHHYHGL